MQLSKEQESTLYSKIDQILKRFFFYGLLPLKFCIECNLFVILLLILKINYLRSIVEAMYRINKITSYLTFLKVKKICSEFKHIKLIMIGIILFIPFKFSKASKKSI